MKNTPEQDIILSETKISSQSLTVKSLAGTGKTTTGVLIAHALPLVPILCLAFNKNIATELQRRMPSHCTVKTVNGLCHGAWLRHIGKAKPRLDTGKNYVLLKAAIDAMSEREARIARTTFSSTLRAIALAKSNGYIPPSFTSVGDSLTSKEELLDIIAPMIDDEPPEMMSLIDHVLEKSIAESYNGYIDFDDQVYMTTLFQAALPRFPIIIVDEAQDLSPLNHRLIERLAPDRLISIGDPWQSIYAFRGADGEAMPKLTSRFEAKELALSVSFRLPKSGVRNAWFRVPHFKWKENAEEGTIATLAEWGTDRIPDGSAILCRNNAPLFAAAIHLIKKGRGVKLVGKDLGKGLVKVLTGLGPAVMNRAEVLTAISLWEKERLAKARESAKSSIEDRADCLRVFAEAGNSLQEAIAYAEHIFAAEGAVQLMTGHKAKGLEFDTVFHLNPWMIPSKWAKEAAERGDSRQMEQDLNLRYVIETRFKKEMYFVNLENMNGH